MKQLVLDIIPAPAPTLANFVVGRNAEALAALAALGGSLGAERGMGNKSMPKVLYLWGVPGSGKTHLIATCLDAGFASLPRVPRGDAPDPKNRYAIDGVDNLDATGQHLLFDLINLQQMSSGLLIAAGSAAPRDLSFRRDLASRLGSGLVFQLLPLSDSEKAEALQAHARSRGFELRAEVVSYLLRHARREMSSLIHILDELDRYSLETGREITLPLLKEMSQPSLV